MDYLASNQAAVIALSTIALVLLTGFYVILTWKNLSIIRKETEYFNRPLFWPIDYKITGTNPSYIVTCKIKNFGRLPGKLKKVIIDEGKIIKEDLNNIIVPDHGHLFKIELNSTKPEITISYRIEYDLGKRPFKSNDKVKVDLKTKQIYPLEGDFI